MKKCQVDAVSRIDHILKMLVGTIKFGTNQQGQKAYKLANTKIRKLFLDSFEEAGTIDGKKVYKIRRIK